MKRAFLFAPVLAFMSVMIALIFVMQSAPAKLPVDVIDRSAPAIDLPALDGSGKRFSNADFGGKVVLLNVFASWCPVCQQEHPSLLRLAKTSNVPIYGINWKDQPGKGMAWLRANTSPYVHVGEDANGAAGDKLGVTGVPETFVVDAKGRIRYRHVGPLTPEVWREVFEPLLAHIKTERGG